MQSILYHIYHSAIFDYDLKGSVYIKTKGGDTIDLSIVPVEFISIAEGESTLLLSNYTSLEGILLTMISVQSTLLEGKRVELSSRLATCRTNHFTHMTGPECWETSMTSEVIDLQSELSNQIAKYNENARLKNYLIESLKSKSISAKTDKNGNINTTLNKYTSYIIKSETERYTGDGIETYSWEIILDSPPINNTLDLNNENMTKNKDVINYAAELVQKSPYFFLGYKNY